MKRVEDYEKCRRLIITLFSFLTRQSMCDIDNFTKVTMKVTIPIYFKVK